MNNDRLETTLLSAPSPDDALRAFVFPPVSARPMLRWWWPGGAVQADAACAQLREFAARGFGGVEIQPFRVGLEHGLDAEAAAGVHEVFTPAWFEVVGAVMDEAERLGMIVDTTFGSCWPFGGGESITPELAAMEATLDWTTLRGPVQFRGTVPRPARPLRSATYVQRTGSLELAQALPDGWTERMAAREATVAVVALRGGVPSTGPFAGFVPMTLPHRWGTVIAPGWVDVRTAVDLTDRVDANGVLDWEVPAGEWQLVTVRRFVSDHVIGEAAGRGPQLVMDHLQRAAFDAHASRVGEPALRAWKRHVGKTWRAVFCDSLELQADLHWSEDFAQEFARRRGYDPRPFLPLMLHPGWRNCFQARPGAPLFDDAIACPRVREDYRRTVSELMLERCYAAFSGWAASHGLQSRTQAHGAPVDWLQAYGLSSMPETEDLMGGAAPHLLRVARAAAHVYGRPLVSAEAFCWLVEGLAVTPRKVRERADEFFASGVQQIIGHGASAPLIGREGKQAWYPWHDMEFGTQLDDHDPLWTMLQPLATYMARCQTALRRGRALVPVAVLAPLDLFGFAGAGDRLAAPAWHEALQEAGLDWDWLNDDGALKSAFDPATREIVTPGGHRYAALVLPDLSALDVDVAERIADWAAVGLTVLAIDQLPSRASGWLDAAARDARVLNAMRSAMPADRGVVAPSRLGAALRAAGVAPCLDLSPAHGLRFVARDDDGQHWLFVRRPHGSPAAATASLAVAEGHGVEQWDAWSGERRRLEPALDGRFPLTLDEGDSLLLRVGPAASCVARVERSATRGMPPERTLPGPWQVEGDGAGLHGRPLRFMQAWPRLEDVSRLPDIADFSGQLHYAVTFDITDDDLQQEAVLLDLGAVHDAASVSLNGGAACVMPEGPFVVDVRPALRPGENSLRIVVANRPENARRDPAHPGGIPLPGRRLQRLPAGLLGPVRLRSAASDERVRWRIQAHAALQP